MTQSDRHGSQPTDEDGISSLSIAMLISFLICVSIFAYFVTNQTPVDDSAFAFQSTEIDQERLNSERASRLGDKKIDLSDPRAEKLISTARMRNAEQFSTLLSETERRRRDAEVVHRANEVLEMGWFPAFWAVGEKLMQECKAELSKVVVQIQKGAKPESFRKGDLYIHFRESCGDILPALFKRNLLTQHGQWVDKNGAQIADLSRRYAWAYILAERNHPSRQLTPYEYELYETWRITNTKGFSEKERMNYLKRADFLIKGFPTNLVLGKLSYQKQDYKSALDYLRKAEKKNEGGPEIGKLVRFLEKKTSAH